MASVQSEIHPETETKASLDLPEASHGLPEYAELQVPAAAELTLAREEHLYQNNALIGITFKSNLLSPVQLKEKADFLVTHLLNHPAACDLVTQVLKQGKININFTSHESLASYAEWDNKTRTIYLTNRGLENILFNCIFELCNADNSLLNEIVSKNFETAYDYALAIEKAEHLSSKRSAHIIFYGLQESRWKLLSDNDLKKELETFQSQSERTFDDCFKGQTIPSIQCHGFSHFEISLKQFLHNKKLRLAAPYYKELLRIKKEQTSICTLQVTLSQAMTMTSLMGDNETLQKQKKESQELSEKFALLQKEYNEVDEKLRMAVKKIDEEMMAMDAVAAKRLADLKAQESARVATLASLEKNIQFYKDKEKSLKFLSSVMSKVSSIQNYNPRVVALYDELQKLSDTPEGIEQRMEMSCQLLVLYRAANFNVDKDDPYSLDHLQDDTDNSSKPVMTGCCTVM